MQGRRGRTSYLVTNLSPFKIKGAVTLKRGRYPYKCTVDSHAELGMKGVLKVT